MDGIYNSLTGAVNLETRLRLVAHDLANINTPGHKRSYITEGSEYPEVLTDVIHRSDPSGFHTDPPTSRSLGDVIFNTLGRSIVDFSQGELRTTGANTDFALDGPGFFTVSVDGQERLTRAGAFEISDLGQLALRVDGRFAPVLGQGGPITLPQGEFTVTADGSLLDANGAAIGALRTVQVDEPQRLERIGSTLYTDPSGQAGVRSSLTGETVIRQGALEQSNADPVTSLVEMIEIQRAYQAVSKAMSAVDEVTSRRLSMSTNG